MTTKIAFDSCAYATYRPDQPAWQQILDQVPDLNLLLLLGDTAYMDWGEKCDFAALNSCYEAQFKIKSFRELIAKVPTLAIWDDHDCGINNIRGAEAPECVMAAAKEPRPQQRTQPCWATPKKTGCGSSSTLHTLFNGPLRSWLTAWACHKAVPTKW